MSAPYPQQEHPLQDSYDSFQGKLSFLSGGRCVQAAEASDCISRSAMVKGSASICGVLPSSYGYDQRLWVHPKDTQYAWQEGRKGLFLPGRSEQELGKALTLLRGCSGAARTVFAPLFLFLMAGPTLRALHSLLLTPIPWAPPAPCLWPMETELEFHTPSTTAPLPKGYHSPVLSRKDMQALSPQALWPPAPRCRVINAS